MTVGGPNGVPCHVKLIFIPNVEVEGSPIHSDSKPSE